MYIYRPSPNYIGLGYIDSVVASCWGFLFCGMLSCLCYRVPVTSLCLGMLLVCIDLSELQCPAGPTSNVIICNGSPLQTPWCRLVRWWGSLSFLSCSAQYWWLLVPGYWLLVTHAIRTSVYFSSRTPKRLPWVKTAVFTHGSRFGVREEKWTEVRIATVTNNEQQR